MKDEIVIIKETRGQHVIKVLFNLFFRVMLCLKYHPASTNHFVSKKKFEWHDVIVCNSKKELNTETPEGLLQS